MEVPQLVEIYHRLYLTFATGAELYSSQWHRHTGKEPVTGTRYMVSDNPFGPFDPSSDRLLFGDQVGSIYTTKLIQDPEGRWVLLGNFNYAHDGTYIGELSDPFPVSVDQVGNLIVST